MKTMEEYLMGGDVFLSYMVKKGSVITREDRKRIMATEPEFKDWTDEERADVELLAQHMACTAWDGIFEVFGELSGSPSLDRVLSEFLDRRGIIDRAFGKLVNIHCSSRLADAVRKELLRYAGQPIGAEEEDTSQSQPNVEYTRQSLLASYNFFPDPFGGCDEPFVSAVFSECLDREFFLQNPDRSYRDRNYPRLFWAVTLFRRLRFSGWC